MAAVHNGHRTTRIVRRARGIQSALLAWYRRQRRDLPWRQTRDPYAILLAETLLQQTQVAAAIPYYQRFLQRFPTIHALAAAPLTDVLRAWAGLGYYARARNLHEAARRIVADHGGRVPPAADTLLSLPGVGQYTAGAVASIAFGRRAAAVDGNVARVLARLLLIRDDVRMPAIRRRLWQIAERLLPARGCGDFNQALMELGATTCRPRRPKCEACPLERHCHARAASLQEALPVRAKPRRTRRVTYLVLALTDSRGRWLVETRPSNGLWGGLWQLPARECKGSRPTHAEAAQFARERVGGTVRLERTPSAHVQRTLTHRHVTLVVFRGSAIGRATHAPQGESDVPVRWLHPATLPTAPLSAAMRAVFTALNAPVNKPQQV